MMKRRNNTIITQLCARTACGPRLSEPTCNIDQCSVGKQPAASQWEPRCQSAQGCWRSLNNKPSTVSSPSHNIPESTSLANSRLFACTEETEHPLRSSFLRVHRYTCFLLTPHSASLSLRPSQSVAARHDGPASNRDCSYFRSAVLNFRQTW